MDRRLKSTGRWAIPTLILMSLALGGCVQGEPEEAASVSLETIEGEVRVCKDRCEAMARKHHRVCVREGGDEARCRRRAIESMRACTSDRCAPPPRRPQSCEDRCLEVAITKRRQCVARRGADRACATQARVALASCVAFRCQPPEPPERPEDAEPPIEAPCEGDDCEEERTLRCDDPEACEREGEACLNACRQDGAEVFGACMAERGDVEVCREEGAEVVRACAPSCR